MHGQTACREKKIDSNAKRSVTHEGGKNPQSSVQKKTKEGEKERERRGEMDVARTTRNESPKRNRGGGKRKQVKFRGRMGQAERRRADEAKRDEKEETKKE